MADEALKEILTFLVKADLPIRQQRSAASPSIQYPSDFRTTCFVCNRTVLKKGLAVRINSI
ncbi:MAG: hypothetical protein KZQ99_00945 [Candidatus Thiodiazotropha sp. (ex Dulcina madagascariensis)]|nr:hypothetical protein [Candidatus Thiodiazotropha sp. (ex Epidulcina cf. delphinae)]MCU7933432.1 hypothetical protein [Candidatus Thiodiazotropha sp. (ex Dulcina madagascariensis)]